MTPDEAKRLLQCAEELAPEEGLVRRGWSVYWLEQNDLDKARSYLQEAMNEVHF